MNEPKLIMENEYKIEVEHQGKTVPFTIKPVDKGRNIEFEVWQDGKLSFKLECCTDDVGDTLKLSPQFNSAGIDPELADKVAYAVMSEEE